MDAIHLSYKASDQFMSLAIEHRDCWLQHHSLSEKDGWKERGERWLSDGRDGV